MTIGRKGLTDRQHARTEHLLRGRHGSAVTERRDIVMCGLLERHQYATGVEGYSGRGEVLRPHDHVGVIAEEDVA
jgi:hypothetical protein